MKKHLLVLLCVIGFFFVASTKPLYACTIASVPSSAAVNQPFQIAITQVTSGNAYTLLAFPKDLDGKFGFPTPDTTFGPVTASGTSVTFTVQLSQATEYTYQVNSNHTINDCSSTGSQHTIVAAPTPTPTPTSPPPTGITSITISPLKAARKTDIVVTVNNIFLAPFGTIALTVVPASATGAKRFAEISILTPDAKTCQLDPNPNTTSYGWKAIACAPQDNGTFTFTGTLDTERIFDGISDQNLHSDEVNAKISIGGYRYSGPAEAAFIITSDTPSNTTFTFDSIAPQPAKPGDTVTLTISHTLLQGTYTFGMFDIDHNKQINVASQECSSSPCKFAFTLPADIKQQSVYLFVQDPNHSAPVEKSLSLAVPPANPTGVGIGPVATLTPTPPPPPPCKVFVDPLNGKPIPTEKYKDPNTPKKCSQVETAIGAINTDPVQFMKQLFAILLSLSGGIAVYIIIVSGYKIMMSQGNPEDVKEGQERITSAIIGIAFMAFALVILETIGVDIFHIPGLTH